MVDNYFSELGNSLFKNMTDEERKAYSFRQYRDKKLSETDYLVIRDYPLTEEQFKKVSEYRQKLRDMTTLEGFPWDGGAALTPWPEVPEVVSNRKKIYDLQPRHPERYIDFLNNKK